MLNKVQIIGNLGRDPEVRYTQSGTAVCNFSVATSETWKDKKTGQKKEETEWFRCEAWDKQAEIIAEYLAKGSKVYVEGKLKTEKWTDKQTGQERTATKLVVRNVIFLSKVEKKKDADGDDVGGGGGEEQGGGVPDDIPF